MVFLYKIEPLNTYPHISFTTFKDVWLQCRFCKEFYADEKKLHKHVLRCRFKTDSSAERSKCSFCDKSILGWDKRTYYNHMRNEHHEQIKSIWFPCPTCGKLFPSKLGIRSHLGFKYCEKALPTTSKEKEEKSRLIVLELKDKERIELLRDPEDVNQGFLENNQIMNTRL